METKYRLSCSLEGHEQDVRAVCAAIFPNNGIISASRDSTARVWARVEGSETGYMESLVLGGHAGFVSSVAVLPPDESNIHGIILTGSNDHTINAYTLDSPSPIYTLKGHEGNVCALVTGKFGTVLSGSWDKTARVWLRQKCVFTLQGHEAAVWTVALLPEAGLMLTGSADKTIRLWKAGKCEKTFTGHEDCVRGLAILSAAEFLSCSNDGTIRRWLTSGECSAVYAGHDNYVYSIALMANGEDFASCGEDRTLRVWRHGQCVQTIPHPTQSVWTVCVLDNDDIVTGSSDGVVRVFTRNEARVAADEELEIYDAMVQSSTVPAQIGDLRTDQLPGPDFLLNPGTRDGQTVMIRRGDKIEAHQWSAGDDCWHKLGDVLGGAGGGDQSKPTGGKTTYAGKEYDYVFDIRLNEGPPMKLPFNVTDDPWMEAHKFLERNDLSQMYLDQVANYIIDQTKGVTLQSQAPAYSDPFTGGSRYVPSSSVAAVPPPAAANQNVFSDPLTGGSRYVPGAGSAPSAPTSTASNTHYPEKNYVSFDNANITAMQGKLREFNADVDNSVKLPESFLNDLPDIVSGKTFSNDHLQAFHTALKWPAGKLFPLLDALRLSVRHRQANAAVCQGGEDSLLAYIVRLLTPDGLPTNRLVAARVCFNAFAHEAGERLLISLGIDVVGRLVRCREATNDKNWQVAAATLLLNYAVALRRSRDVFPSADAFTAELLRALIGLLLVWTWDVEATYRLLVATGTVITSTPSARTVANSLDLTTAVRRCIDTHNPTKATECALALLKDI